jgi:lysophospholipase L1-like esterase
MNVHSYAFYKSVNGFFVNIGNVKYNYNLDFNTEITIPDTAKYVGIQYRWNGNGSLSNIKVYFSNTFVYKFILPIWIDFEGLSNSTTDIIKTSDKVLAHFINGYINGAGTITTSDTFKGWATDFINCSEGDKFLYYGFGSGSSSVPVEVGGGMGASWIFYDSQNQRVSAWATGVLDIYEVVIPSGVANVRFCGLTYSPTKGNIPFGAYYKSFISEIKNKIDNISNITWNGVKWIAIGDSLTEHNLRATKNYHDYVKDWTDITVVNRGHSGCGYKENYSINGAFYQRVQTEIPNDANVITIFGSGNDLHYNGSSMKYQLGEVTDTGTITICGCINTTLDYIQEHFPLVPLGLITPTPWYSLGTMGNQTPLIPQCDMEKYADAIIEICKRRGIPVLDLYHCSNLHPDSIAFRDIAYRRDGTYAASTEGTSGAIQVTSDNLSIVREFGVEDAEIGDWVLPTLGGVHPDERGHELIAPRFKAFLETLIKK